MFINKVKIISLIIIYLTSSCFAQNKYDFNQFWDDTKTFVKQPGQWDKNDWLTLGVITGSTFGIMFLDETVREAARSNTAYEKSIPAEFGRLWGEPISTGIIGGAFLLHGIIADNNGNKKVGFEVIQSFIYTSATIGVIKIGFGRARPYMGGSAFEFHPIQLTPDDYWSLASGHTSTAFSFSTVLAENVENDLLKVLCYVPAFMTGASRIYQNYHWLSDVFLGASIGYFVGKFVTDIHKENDADLVKPAEQLNFSIPL